MSRPPSRPHPAWALVIPALVFLVYANSLDNGFHFDDFHTIVDNPSIQALSEIPRFFHDPTAFSTKNGNWPFRPVLLTVNALNYAAARFSLPAWHLVNLALHALNAFLVFLLAASVFRLRAGAVAAGLIFAVHPLNSQAVNYFSARASLLAATFVLAGLLAQAQARQRQETGQESGPWIILASLLFLLGLLAKEEAAVFPFLALGLAAFDPTDQSFRWPRGKQWFALLPAGIILALFLGLRFHFQKTFLLPHAAEMAPIYSRLQIALTGFISPWIYFHRFLWPLSLSVLSQVRAPDSVLDPAVLAGAASYAWLGLLFWRIRHRPAGAVVIGTLWYLAALLPAMVLILNVLIAEHHAYLALAGLLLALGAGLEMALSSPRPRIAQPAKYLVTTGVICFSLLTLLRNSAWQDEITLWRDAVAKGPAQFAAQSLLGAAYAKAGQYQQARQRLEVAVRLRPNFADAHNTLSLAYLRLGRVDQAEAEIREAWRLAPDNLTYLNNLGILLMLRQRWNEALTVFNRVLQIEPDHPRARDYRDQVLEKLRAEPAPFHLPGQKK